MQPAWATEEKARAVSLSDTALPVRPLQEDHVYEQRIADLERENRELRERNADLERRLAAIEALGELKEQVAGRTVGKQGAKMPALPGASGRGVDTPPSPSPATPPTLQAANLDAEQLYAWLKARLIREAPALLKVLVETSELEITVKRETVTVDGSGWLGRTAGLIAEGFFEQPRKSGEVFKELARRGATGIPARADEACKSLLATGFLTREAEGFRAVQGMKVRIVEAA